MLKAVLIRATSVLSFFLSPYISHSAPLDVTSLLRDASSAYADGRVKDSINMFETAIQVRPEVKGRLWQLGLSQYSAGEYNACASQFEYDYARNPDDTEEVVWAFLCNMKKSGGDGEYARKQMPAKRSDPRLVMRKVEEAYRTNDVSALQKDITDYEADSSPLKGRPFQQHADYFYAALYTSLFYEAKKDDVRAQHYLQKAVSSFYGQKSKDYMTTVAHVLASDRLGLDLSKR